MTSSAYIGRVGGLAVALGIGAALASGTAIARADDEGTSQSQSAPESAGATSAQKPDVAPKVPKSDTAGEASGAQPATKKARTDRPVTTSRPHRKRTDDDSAPVTEPSTADTSIANPEPVKLGKRSSASAPHRPATVVATAISTVIGSAPTRRTSTSTAAVATLSTSTAQPVTDDPTPAVAASTVNRVAAATAPRPMPTNLATWVQRVIYEPVHTGVQLWINSDIGKRVNAVINRLAGSYVIGNGSAGTAENPDGGAAGWMFGDGGAGWNSTEDGVAGGRGGAAGLFGTGGVGGSGGAGAEGGAGGRSGLLMGVGGEGGAGGTGLTGGTGGAGGCGGDAAGTVFGIGGDGGKGGDGPDGGRGGNGGNGAVLIGAGGAGGDAGASGLGGDPLGLPAVGGAGGTSGWLGAHGAVGRSTFADVSVDASDAPVLSISPQGTWLTTSDGQVVILHGVNEVYKLDPYDPAESGFGEDDAAFLAANGFNVVRLGIIWAAVEPEPGIYDQGYIASLGNTVQLLADHGVYTILDMHQDLYSTTFNGEGAPEWATFTGGLPNRHYGFPGSYYLNPAMNHAWDQFWANADASDGLGLQDHYTLAWQQIAAHFSGNPAVIGYDIMNEAWPGTSWPIALLGGTFFGYQQLAPLYNQVAAAIRTVDPTTSLFIEPANPGVTEVLDILGGAVSLGAVDDPNTVLAFHNYCAGPSTSAICPFIANQLAGGAHRYGVKHDIPVFMNEFGATDAPSDLNAQMRAANRLLMGWSVWAYTGKGDITTSGGQDAESLVYDPALPPVGDNVNTGNLVTLSVPYPQVVSGTPSVWSFANGTLRFGYSTEKVDGSGVFAAGSPTVISVPAVQYPNGYAVTVTGGHVVSAPNAAALVIASDEGATEISVVVIGSTVESA